MKNISLIILLFNFCILKTSAQEVSLFNGEGEAIAYIDYQEDATIFLWEGTPLAFLENDENEKAIIGFNGDFVGWYDGGIIYDGSGYPVGGKEDAINIITKIEIIKGIQKITPIRPISPITPIQPIWRM